MIDLKIVPLKGVGEIRFGMSPDEVRKAVGVEFRSFKRSPLDDFPSDYFEQINAFFYYDSEGYLEAAEFAKPAHPMIDGIDLLSLSFEAAKDALSTIDDQIRKEVDSAIAYQKGVSIWAPLAKDDPSAPVESVLVFRPGYYN